MQTSAALCLWNTVKCACFFISVSSLCIYETHLKVCLHSVDRSFSIRATDTWFFLDKKQRCKTNRLKTQAIACWIWAYANHYDAMNASIWYLRSLLSTWFCWMRFANVWRLSTKVPSPARSVVRGGFKWNQQFSIELILILDSNHLKMVWPNALIKESNVYLSSIGVRLTLSIHFWRC